VSVYLSTLNIITQEKKREKERPAHNYNIRFNVFVSHPIYICQLILFTYIYDVDYMLLFQHTQRSKLQSVKLQALSGIILALSNTILPSFLSHKLGNKATVRGGMLGLIFSLGVMASTQSSDSFKYAVCGASVSTLCLPLLMSRLARCYEVKEAGACLSALETANTLNRAMV
jgi:hypothetical protein